MKQQKKSKSNLSNSKQKFAITRGIYKGLSLFLESNAVTRPTKSLVKKSFFDTMQDDIQHKIFVECFAGSGQMGFEALSMGAKKALFFEYNNHAYENLNANITIFKQKALPYLTQLHEKNHTLISDTLDSEILQHSIYSYHADFFSSLPTLNLHIEKSKKSLIEDEKISNFSAKNAIITRTFPLGMQQIMCNNRFILYLDPPFSCRNGFYDIYIKIANFIESFNKDLLEQVDFIIIEKMSDVDIAKNLSIFSLAKISKFGKTSLAYFTK